METNFLLLTDFLKLLLVFWMYFFFTLRYLISFKNLLRSIENIGISMVYGINYFARGKLHNSSYIHYVRHEALGNDLLNSSLNYVPSLRQLYMDLTTRMGDYGNIRRRLECWSIWKMCEKVVNEKWLLCNKLKQLEIKSYEEMSNKIHT